MVLTALMIIGGVAVAVVLIDRRRMRLPDVPDDEFIRRFEAQFGPAPHARILAERAYLGRTLGVAAARLAPEHSWRELRKHAPLVSFDVGLTDVGNDLHTRLERAGADHVDLFPETVGAVIRELIRLDEKEAKNA